MEVRHKKLKRPRAIIYTCSYYKCNRIIIIQGKTLIGTESDAALARP